MALTKIKTGSVSDSITLTTPDINGGTIDATVIGGTTPAAISGTTGTFNAGVNIGGNSIFNAPNIDIKADDARLLIEEADGTNMVWLGDLTGAGVGGCFLYNHGGTAVVQLRSDSASTIGHGLNVGGNVGVNTSSPDAIFTVDSNVGGSSTGTIARFHSSKGESDSTFLQIAATRHGTASVQRVQLQAFDDDGSTPRTLCLNNAGGDVLVSKATTAFGTAGIRCAASGALDLTVSNDGSLFCNRLAGDGGTVYFYRQSVNVGSISVTGSATAYNTSSDYRLKENVVPMTGSIDRVKALKPSRFNFIVDADNTVDGFLAHEAQEVVPECVTGTKDAMKDEEYEVTAAVEEVRDEDDNVTTEAAEAVMGTRSVPDMQGIDQSKLVPLLVAALQEAIARIEILEGA